MGSSRRGRLSRYIRPNWWMLPAVAFVVWRAWDEDRLWIYMPLGVAGVALGIWLNHRENRKEP